MGLHVADWVIIVGYLALTVVIGFLVRRRASEGMESYFAGSRSFPWWLVGISMVATTFAADTPLAVTAIVAKDGLSGNWFWWSLFFSHLAVVFVVAGLWNRARVITDAELIELRYDGIGAPALRGFKAFFFAIIINCITMGWVIRAVGKIVASFVDWTQLAPGLHDAVASVWPGGLAIETANEAISIVIMSVIALTYATLGGLRSVVFTDLLQFLLAMTGSILLAVFAVSHVGGLDSLVSNIHTLYPESAEKTLSLFPRGMASGALFGFVMYLTVQWWAQHNSDGGGYFAQRIGSARSTADARKGTLLFVILHYLARTWPWLLVGLVALVVYPAGVDPQTITDPEYARVLADRETAYPLLVLKLLPTGLVGLLFASLVAAFMSTIDTHVNWGSSYLVNDLYKRFWKPGASEKQLVRAAQMASLLILVLGLVTATQVTSVEGAWKFFTALGAGLGAPHLLRWVWWRVNAWTELAGLVAAALTTAFLYLALPELDYAVKLLITVGVSLVASLVATFATPAVSRPHLEKFYQQVRPFGFWKGIATTTPHTTLARPLALWILSCALMMVSMIALHQLFLGSTPLGIGLGVVCVGGWGWVWKSSCQA
jgi:SSS family transporter